MLSVARLGWCAVGRGRPRPRRPDYGIGEGASAAGPTGGVCTRKLPQASAPMARVRSGFVSSAAIFENLLRWSSRW